MANIRCCYLWKEAYANLISKLATLLKAVEQGAS
jgi:hypothetical protein